MQALPTGSLGLRPLTIGELLDRAISTVAANLPTYLIVCLCYAVPQIALSFHTNAQSGDSLLEAMNLSSLKSDPSDPSALDYLAVAYATIVGTIEYAVLFVFADRLSYGSKLSLGAGLRIALRHLPRVFGCAFLYVVLIVVDVGILFALAFLAFLGSAYAVVWMLVTLVALILFVANVFPCFVIQFATIAVANEGIGIRAALRAGIRRLWSPGRFGRAVLVNTLGACVILAGAIAALAVGSATELVDSSGTLLNASVLLGTMVSTAIVATMLSIFSRDLRVRAEGLDLELAVAQIAYHA